MSELQAFEGWAVVEVMGHRVLAGYCDHVRVAGTEMLRVVPPGPNPGDPTGSPDILSAGAVFAVHPCSEEEARSRSNPAAPHFATVIVGQRPPQLCGYEPEPDDPEDWDDGDDPGPDAEGDE